jgi:molybdenum cofactor cytidylyltransferase
MGRPKLLLPWRNTSVLGHLIGQWQKLGAEQIAVVCAQGDTALAAELDRLGFAPDDRIINPDSTLGMFSSIKCAAGWNGWDAALTHWAVALGDQPHLSLQTLQQLLNSAEVNSNSICVPRYQGRRRHPVILPKREFLCCATSPVTDLKAILDSASRMHFCELDDPGLALDIDFPEDYAKARQLFEQRV